MYQKPYTCTEINVLLHFSELRALILRYNNERGIVHFQRFKSISTSESGVKIDILCYYH